MKFNFFNSYNQLIINTTQNFSFEIFPTEFSGKVVFRNKILSTSHTAIGIGVDINGRELFIHSHSDTGKAVLATREEVSKGKQLLISNEECVNSSIHVINDALNAVLLGEEYHYFFNNCQHFTSSICSLKKESKDVEKIATAGVGFAAGVMMQASEDSFIKGLGKLIIVGSIGYALHSTYTAEESAKRAA